MKNISIFKEFLPRWLVCFPWHSYAYTPDDAWEAGYKPLLILAETGLYVVLLWGLYQQRVKHGQAGTWKSGLWGTSRSRFMTLGRN